MLLLFQNLLLWMSSYWKDVINLATFSKFSSVNFIILKGRNKSCYIFKIWLCEILSNVTNVATFSSSVKSYVSTFEKVVIKHTTF